MLNHAIKKIILALLLSYISLAHAINTPVVDTATPSAISTPSSTAPQTNAPGNTNAINFAKQAGKISGVVQACGQDVSVFNNRVGEALNKLAASPTDKVLALQAFQDTMRQAQAAEQKSQLIPCTEAIKDFQSLPLMRNDYQQSVLTQLSPTMESPTNPSPASSSSAPNTANASANSANQPATPSTLPAVTSSPNG